VFLLISLVGILSLLLLVTASVAYLALPRGRLCPHCGGATNPVVLWRLLRLLSPWVQWRWCSRCSWEGPGRRGPALDPPADPGSGFRWGARDSDDAQIFYWRSRGRGGKDQRDNMNGFEWQSAGGPTQPTDPTQPGADFEAPGEVKPPALPWDRRKTRGRRSVDDGQRRTQRPWYLSWLVSKDQPGFHWKERED
jgi:hypothetical protein